MKYVKKRSNMYVLMGLDGKPSLVGFTSTSRVFDERRNCSRNTRVRSREAPEYANEAPRSPMSASTETQPECPQPLLPPERVPSPVPPLVVTEPTQSIQEQTNDCVVDVASYTLESEFEMSYELPSICNEIGLDWW